MPIQDTLHFRHNTVQQGIRCAIDTIADLGDFLDGLGVRTAMLLCGPSILRHADVVQRR